MRDKRSFKGSCANLKKHWILRGQVSLRELFAERAFYFIVSLFTIAFCLHFVARFEIFRHSSNEFQKINNTQRRTGVGNTPV